MKIAILASRLRIGIIIRNVDGGRIHARPMCRVEHQMYHIYGGSWTMVEWLWRCPFKFNTQIASTTTHKSARFGLGTLAPMTYRHLALWLMPTVCEPQRSTSVMIWYERCAYKTKHYQKCAHCLCRLCRIYSKARRSEFRARHFFRIGVDAMNRKLCSLFFSREHYKYTYLKKKNKTSNGNERALPFDIHLCTCVLVCWLLSVRYLNHVSHVHMRAHKLQPMCVWLVTIKLENLQLPMFMCRWWW